jgi:DNA gyrase subunit B
MLSSDEIKALIVAMGAGIGDELNIDKIRYHKIVIMTDADVDGAHIRTLLLTFIYRHYPEIIQRGYLYIAQPPLYAISKGKKKYYAYTDTEKDLLMNKLAGQPLESEPKAEIEEEGGSEGEVESSDDTKKSKNGYSIQRYKGLGEMNPTQLWETTMDPDQRVMLKVTIEDAEKVDQIFSMLMGDEVPPRKHFIQTHAKKVKNLDI